MLTGRSGASSVMVGRSGALARLVDLVDAAEIVDGDQPAIALIAGEAGIGKTRLVRELLAAIGPGVSTFVVAGEPGSIGRAHAALGSFADRSDPAACLLGAIEEAVASGTTLLVIEDVHWLDAESATAVDAIARQPWPNLVIAGTYRASDLSRGAPGGELVLRLERRHAVEQIRLDRLDRAEIAAMVASIIRTQPSSAVVEAVDRRSGGVPFVIEELLRCCGAHTFADDVLTADLPWSLEEAVRQQVSGLGPDERLAVEVLAVYGRAISFDTLQLVADLDDARALAALRRLVERNVVVESTDERFWFVHALVADAVAGQLIGRERRRLHERCFEAERTLDGADPATLARHAAGAGRYDEIVAIAHAGAPAYLARGASFQALRLAADALAEAPDDVLLLAVATEAAWRLDFNDEAMTTASRWTAVATLPADRVEAERLHGRLHHEQGEDAGRRAAVQRLMAMADELADLGARALAEAAVAQLLMLGGESVEAVEWADRAIAHGEAAADPHAVARAKVERASALSSLVDRQHAIATLDDAVAAARAVGDPVLESRALNNSLDSVSPHTDAGRRVLNALIDVTRRSGFDKLGGGQALFWQTRAAIGNGDMQAVRRCIGEAAHPDVTATHGDTTVAFLALEEGRFDDAARSTYGIVASCRSGKPPLAGLEIRVAAAIGEHERARELFDHVLALPQIADLASLFDDVLLIVEGALAAGIPTTDIRTRFVDGWLAGHASFDSVAPPIVGMLALADGHHDVAIRELQRTLDRPDERISRPMLGTLRTALATALLAEGDRAGALAAVTEALEVDLARWPGVRRDRAEALGRRLQGSSARTDGELTSREREVAALLAEGLTNGQLAERLYISPKTAAVHVSHILTKLGLSSRAEIAAWAVRHGIALAEAS